MRKRCKVMLMLFFFLLLGLQACNFPGQVRSTPEPDTGTMTPDIPTETETQLPVEISTGTAAITPSLTETESLDVTLPIFPNPVIFDFEMFTPLHGWALTQDNDRLLRTLDGGQTWLDATPAELHPLPPDVISLWIDAFFLDAETAWFTPNSLGSELYHSRDGGLSWSITPIPFERARYYFLDENLGYALVDLGAGAGSQYVAIHRTEDGGTTWTEVFTHEPGEMKSLKESGQKAGITFLDKDHGWIGGNYSMTDYFYLHFTVDGGVTWTLETDISLPDTYAGSWLGVHQPVFMTDNIGYLPVRALTPDDDVYLLIYRSDDSGQSWTFQSGVLEGESVDFYSSNAGYLAASTELYQTTDSGISWSTVTGSGIPAGEFFLAVDFVDSQHGWVIATPDDETWDPRKLYRTTDGSVNWTQIVP